MHISTVAAPHSEADAVVLMEEGGERGISGSEWGSEGVLEGAHQHGWSSA